jgi:hypothetical protein
MGDEVFQFAALPVTEREQGHRFTPPRTWRIESHSTCQRTSVTMIVFPSHEAQRLENKAKRPPSLNKGMPIYDPMSL